MMHYDVAVIGGGIAGYSAALRALQAGKKSGVNQPRAKCAAFFFRLD